MIQKTFKLSDETSARLTSLTEELTTKGTISKQADLIEVLLASYYEKPPVVTGETSEEIQALNDEIGQLKEEIQKKTEISKENQQFTSLITNLSNLYETTPEELFTTASDVKKQIAKSTERISEQAGTIASLQEENKSLEEKLASHSETPADGLVVNLSPIEKVLLEATVAKLSERYKKEITAEEILRKMFLRYTVEQYCEWFYPFVLKDRDIEKITGKTITELKRFFR